MKGDRRPCLLGPEEVRDFSVAAYKLDMRKEEVARILADPEKGEAWLRGQAVKMDKWTRIYMHIFGMNE